MKGKGIVYRVERSIRHDVVDDFRRGIHNLHGKGVWVGLPKNSKPQKPRRDAQGRLAKGAQAISMILIGATLHYGTKDGRIPPRPWLNKAIRAARTFLRELNALNLRKVLHGTMTAEIAAERLGNAAAGKVREFIAHSENFTPNAQSTIDAKGSSSPLIDKGQLRQEVTYTTDKGNT